MHLDHWVSISKEPLCFKLLCGADLLESFAVPGLWNTEDLTTIVSSNLFLSRPAQNTEELSFLDT